jgi:hypothetical protein
MDIKVLDAQGVGRELRRLMERYDEFHWSVAWATTGRQPDNTFAPRRIVGIVVSGLFHLFA